MIIYITAKGPKLCAASVSLKIATNAEVQRIQVNEAVLKKLIYFKNVYLSEEDFFVLFFFSKRYLVYVTWSCFDIITYHG